MSESDIVTAYNMGLESIEQIEKFIEKHGKLCQFAKRDQRYYTLTNLVKKKTLNNSSNLEQKMDSNVILLQKKTTPFLLKREFMHQTEVVNLILICSQNR